MISTRIDPADFALARTTIGLTTAELAELFGLTEGEIVAMEAGRYPIDPRTALAMAYLVTVHRAADPDLSDPPGGAVQ